MFNTARSFERTLTGGENKRHPLFDGTIKESRDVYRENHNVLF